MIGGGAMSLSLQRAAGSLFVNSGYAYGNCSGFVFLLIKNESY